MITVTDRAGRSVPEARAVARKRELQRSGVALAVGAWLGGVALLGCEKPKEPPGVSEGPTSAASAHAVTSSSTPADAAQRAQAIPPPTPMAGPARLVAIGDLHGDLDAARRALRL